VTCQKSVKVAGFFCLLVSFASPAISSRPLYKDKTLPIKERVNDLLSRMTLQEKIAMLYGDKTTHLDTLPNERLGIPRLSMTDGPHGVRFGTATCFPVGINMAATWNEGLIHEFGQALSMEALAKERNVVLGPCLNLHRLPHGGRNFESFSEDPYLTSRIGVAYVKGVQSVGTIAMPKHYACNNQERARKRLDAIVTERALREIYLPAFKACVQEANVWSIMAAYNRVNGIYACEHPYLLTDILKDQWGFQGFVVSDWGGVHSNIATANAGLDIEMPAGQYFSAALLDEVKLLNVPYELINDKVRRILRAMFASGIFDGDNKVDSEKVNSSHHQALARRIAAQSIVLLKNDKNTLPLKKEAIKTLTVIGPGAAVARLGGSGSSEVNAPYAISPLEGIKEKLGDTVDILYAQGCHLDSIENFQAIDASVTVPPEAIDQERGLKAEFFDNPNLEGQSVATTIHDKMEFWWGWEEPMPGVPVRNFSVRWTGKLIPQKTGTYRLAASSEQGTRLYLDGELVIDNWWSHQVVTETYTTVLEEGKSYDIRFEFYNAGHYSIVKLGWEPFEIDSIKKAVEIAKKADAVIIIAGLDKPFEGEGHDRTSLDLPGRQDELIRRVLQTNPNTIVILNNGTPVLMNEWVDSVPAIVEAWYPGQEGGRAVADVLFGDVNPSGKLPVTFPVRWQDCPAYDVYPGNDKSIKFTEDIYVGYRYFDTQNIEPLFAFGHGLSYTKFEYGNIKLGAKKIIELPLEVKIEITNIGKAAGDEVVQLYVHDIKSTLDRPLKELKAFQRVSFSPNETKTVSFSLNKQAFSYYDPNQENWVMEPGEFEILIGSSSRDIRAKKKISYRKG
jgi:beta-glucosidase